MRVKFVILSTYIQLGIDMFKWAILAFACSSLATQTFAASKKFAMDISFEKLNYTKPNQGIGRAGSLIFKSASMVNDDLVLNITNVNNMFDSQIFVRPTFIGATTQFGNFGTNVEESNLLNTILKADLEDANVLFDENQVNFSGKLLNFSNATTTAKLEMFRVYCQNSIVASTESQTPDVMKTCLNFLTLNGSFSATNPTANVEYVMKLGENLSDKLYVQSKIRSFDIRKTQISLDIPSITTVSNDLYKIEASNLKLNCAKDEDLDSVDVDKIKKACTNKLNMSAFKASLTDPKEKTRFGLDMKSLVIKDKILYASLNSAVVSDPATVTTVSNLIFNCKKDTDSDIFMLNDMLSDCISYSRISIGEVKSDSKVDDDKDSSNKNIAISINNGVLVLNAEVRFLGLKSQVTIYGKIAHNQARKQIIVSVTDTKLPLGINSVKLVMYFLKKNLVSKDISISGNTITISL